MRTVFLAVLAALLLGACQSAPVRDDRFVRFFDEMAFGSGLDGASQKAATLRRWEGPLVWSAQGSDTFRETVRARVARIAEIAGRESREVAKGGGIRFHQDPVGTAYPVQDNLTSCFARVLYAGDEIVRVTIRIAEDSADRVIRCTDHEVMHGLGFGFHSAAIASVMSPLHDEQRLSRWDVMAVRALMSDDFAAGSAREIVLAEVTRQLPNLRAFADNDTNRHPTD